MAENTRKQISVSFDALAAVMCDTVDLDRCSPLRALLRYGTDSNALRAYRAAMEGKTPSELGLAIRVDADPEALTLQVHNDGPGVSAEDIEVGIRDAEAVVDARTTGLKGSRETELVYDGVKSFAQAVLWSIRASEQVIIDSLTAEEGDSAWQLRYTGGDTYDLSDGDRTTVGTTITLRLKSGFSHLCDPQVLPDQLRRHGDYLQYPIFWQGRQINTMSPPWHQEGATAEDHAAFLRSQFSDRPPPVLVVPLKTGQSEVDLRGVLWVPGEDLRLFDSGTGTVRVYHRRLLVEEASHDILPQWARFFRGIIDIGGLSSGFSPIDVDHQTIRNIVERSLLDRLSQLVVTEPDRFMGVAQNHDQLLKLAALENDRVFDIVVDQLSFRTSNGPRTLPQCLAEMQHSTGESRIEYRMVPLDASPYSLRQIPRLVIDASAGLDEAVLEKYDQRNPAVELTKIDAPNKPVPREIADDRFQPIVDLLSEMDPPVTARPARFEPSSIAAVFSPVEEDQMRSQLQQLFMLSQVSGAIPPDARDALQRAVSAKASHPPPDVLHFNVNCPAVEGLLEAVEEGKIKLAREVAEIMVMRAQLIAGNVDASRLGDSVNRMINRALRNTPRDAQ